MRCIFKYIDFIIRAGPSGFRMAVGARNFLFSKNVQIGSGAHSAS
jgi:hypothetical protein